MKYCTTSSSLSREIQPEGIGQEQSRTSWNNTKYPWTLNILFQSLKIHLKRAKKCALETLQTQQRKHSKMERLEYQELKIQDYFLLPGLEVKQARKVKYHNEREGVSL